MIKREIKENSNEIRNDLMFRKDVVNKYILRSFRKSISKLFRSKFKRPSRSSQSFEFIRESIQSEAVRLGLINNIDDINEDENTKEYKEFV
mmetsp:Transcript_12737/g.14337  ORF Transcript_12737/g.14337 Transcript_12737/m.14337 type:complete len:91 (-) Transcript_12737:288-560(-)